MHLFGFVIRIYHDVRSPERQTKNVFYVMYYFSHYGRARSFMACMRPRTRLHEKYDG